MIFVFLFIFLLFVFWLWALISCLTSRLTGTQKLFWLIIIIFFSLIGALLYFIFSKTTAGEKMKTSFKGKKLFRSKKNKVIAGVCGGIGEYFNVDPVLIRLLWVVFTLMYGAGILAYIIAWIIIPKER
jgi:phage shock protein C